MTKKDFQLIAATIAGLQLDGTQTQCNTRRQEIAEHFADVLSDTNPLFKRDLFVQAATGQVAVTARKARSIIPRGTTSAAQAEAYLRANGIAPRTLASDLAEDR